MGKCKTKAIQTDLGVFTHIPAYVAYIYIYIYIYIGSCSVVGRPLCSTMRATRARFTVEVIPTDLPTGAARPTQPSILPRSVNEYQIIPELTLGHRR